MADFPDLPPGRGYPLVNTETWLFGSGVMSALSDYTSVVNIHEFVNSGEVLNANGTDVGNNTTIIQRAVDALTALWVADGKPRQIHFPDGTYKLSKQGDEGGENPYCIHWKSGVGISTASRRGVRFMAPTNATPFMAAYSYGNIESVYCDPHIVDGSLQTNSTYTTKLKGWFIQGLKNSRFDDVFLYKTFATGFGCDYLVNVQVTGEADGCGRGLIELAIVPTTTSGGSGFGIGTGRYAVEDFTLNVVARNNGFHGVFTESQLGEPFTYTKGARITALVTGNYVGFRDCGCDGLVANITSISNTYAGVLHDRTILAPTAGINGTCTLDSSGDRVGIRMETASAGSYTFTGSIRSAVSHGIWVPSGAALAAHVEFTDMRVHHNGGRGLLISSGSTSLVLHRILFWSNAAGDLMIAGAALAADGLEITEVDVRSGAGTVEQILTNQLIERNRGTLTIGAPTPTIADYFASANTASIVGRTAPNGSSTATWAVASTGGGTYGIIGGQAAPTAGSVATYATITAASASGTVMMTAAVVKGPASRRNTLIARFVDVSNLFRVVCDTGVWVLSKLVAGSATTLITTAVAAASGDVVELRLNGNSIQLYINGVSSGSVTDASHNTSTKFGIAGQYSIDTFSRQSDFKYFAP